MAMEGFLPKETYDLIVAKMPIPCVDTIPVKTEGSDFKLGVITRATGPEAGKLAIVGGRIFKDKKITESISMHLEDSYGSGDFTFHRTNSAHRPFYVAEYKHAPYAEEGYDPTKQAISNTYLIEIDEPREVGNEALDFRWIAPDEIPDESAYNHHLVLREAVDWLIAHGL